MSEPKPKKRKLIAKWSKRENAIEYRFPDYKSNGGLLSWLFEGYKYPHEKTFVQELDERGYDVKTLRFSVERKT